MRYVTSSDAETVMLGRKLAETLPEGVTLLIGNLGAGKTTLAKGLVAALSGAVAADIVSPTFTLIHDYGKVLHIDLYRLETEQEVENLGLEDLIADTPYVLIEWGERFPGLLPARRTEINLSAIDENRREIAVIYPK